MIGIVVQIGLDKKCEYHYLTFSNWKCRMQDQHRLNRIPIEIFLYKSFRYIGIDLCPESIQLCSEKYPENSPTFITAKIESAKGLQHILQDQGVTYIDILAVDIEGYEKLLFAENWNFDMMLPRYIAVEFHPQFLLQHDHKGTLKHFSSNIESAGYQLQREEVTNKSSAGGLTVEQQYLKDVVNL